MIWYSKPTKYQYIYIYVGLGYIGPRDITVYDKRFITGYTVYDIRHITDI